MRFWESLAKPVLKVVLIASKEVGKIAINAVIDMAKKEILNKLKKNEWGDSSPKPGKFGVGMSIQI